MQRMQETIDQLTLHSEQTHTKNTSLQTTLEDLERKRTGLEIVLKNIEVQTERARDTLHTLRFTLKEAEERAKAATHEEEEDDEEEEEEEDEDEDEDEEPDKGKY